MRTILILGIWTNWLRTYWLFVNFTFFLFFLFSFMMWVMCVRERNTILKIELFLLIIFLMVFWLKYFFIYLFLYRNNFVIRKMWLQSITILHRGDLLINLIVMFCKWIIKCNLGEFRIVTGIKVSSSSSKFQLFLFPFKFFDLQIQVL